VASEGGDTQMKITIELDKDQAEALLTVLSRIGPSEVAQLHEGIEWPTFDSASEKLRVALRDAIDLG
jgi:hypothetical protein